MMTIGLIVCIVALVVLSVLLVRVSMDNKRLRQESEQEQDALRQRISELENELQFARNVHPAEPEMSFPTHGELFMAKLQEVMDKHLDNNTLAIRDLVEEMGMGRTVFFNRLKNMTGLSPVEYIRVQRLLRAAQLLESSEYSITEITYMVGMNDSRYFSKCFKARYGISPSDYRKQKRAKA